MVRRKGVMHTDSSYNEFGFDEAVGFIKPLLYLKLSVTRSNFKSTLKSPCEDVEKISHTKQEMIYQMTPKPSQFG